MSFVTYPNLDATVKQIIRSRKEISWVVFGQFISFAGGFAVIKVLTSIMGPEGYGQLALGLTIAGLLNLFIYGPISQWILRYFSVCRENNVLDSYFYLIRRLFFLSTAIVLFVVLLSAGILIHVVGKEWMLVAIMAALFGITTGVNISFVSLQTSIRQRQIVALHQGADPWLRLLFAVIALYLFQGTGYYALLGFLTGTLLISLSQSVFALANSDVRNHWRSERPDKKDWHNISGDFFRYAHPFVYYAIFGAVSLYADRWFLQAFYGEAEVGIYAAMYQIANAPLVLIAGVMNQLMIPIIFSRAGAMTHAVQHREMKKLLNQTVIISSMIMLSVVVIAYVYAEPLTRLLTTNDFAKHHHVLWILVLGLAIFNIAQLLSVEGFSNKTTGLYIWPKLMQAVSFFLLMYLLVRAYGVSGVAIALVGSSVIYLIMVAMVNRWKLEIVV
jgi:O-antigen/teichoic acid export membrane protein